MTEMQNPSTSEIFSEEEYSIEYINNMPSEEKMAKLNQYRKNAMKEFNEGAYKNSVRILRSLRARQIAENPHATKAAKAKAKAVTQAPLDLDSF